MPNNIEINSIKAKQRQAHVTCVPRPRLKSENFVVRKKKNPKYIIPKLTMITFLCFLLKTNLPSSPPVHKKFSQKYFHISPVVLLWFACRLSLFRFSLPALRPPWKPDRRLFDTVSDRELDFCYLISLLTRHVDGCTVYSLITWIFLVFVLFRWWAISEIGRLNLTAPFLESGRHRPRHQFLQIKRQLVPSTGNEPRRRRRA